MWPIIKKAVNSDPSTPLNTLINNVNSTVNTVKTNVGSNADSASSTGSVHAKIKNIKGILDSGVMLRQAKASNNLMLSSDNEKTILINSEWHEVKTILIMVNGTFRVSFDLANGYGRIYVNGVPIGDERLVTGLSYKTFTEDIKCLMGDTIELWARGRGSDDGKVKNFRVYFDIIDTPKYGWVLNG